MNKFLVGLALAGLVHGAMAQDAEDATAARERISRQRGEVEAVYKADEKACFQKFAVNDCLKSARARRREALADLKRQETSLNDAQRRRKGGERQRAIEERAQAEKHATEPAPPAVKGAPPAPRSSAGATVEEKQAERAQARERNAAEAAARKRETDVRQREKEAESARRKEEAASNAQRQRKAQAEAQEHKANVNKRLAERDRQPAQALPSPP